MDNLSPMGSLSSLPAEVRIEIYRNVFPRQRLPILPVSTTFHQPPEPASLVHPDTAIFQTSKTISREAMDVFYSEHSFKIYLWNFTQPLDMKYHLAHPGLSLIRNVHFKMDMVMDLDVYSDDSRYEASVCRNIILGFSGSETPRNTLRITLFFGQSEFRVGEIALFRNLSTMTGFRKVVVEIKPPRSPSPSSTEYTAWHEKMFGSFGVLASMVVEKLAPSLGPGVVEFRKSRCHVEFQPRAHLAGKPVGKRHVLF